LTVLRIEPGSKDDEIAFIFLAAGADAVLGDLFDRAIGGGIDQEHVILVEGMR